jgi:hypothetical protein
MPLRFSDGSLKYDDFIDSSWQDVLASASSRTIEAYWDAFASTAEKAASGKNETAEKAFRFLQYLTSMRPNFDDPQYPYRAGISLADSGRSHNLDDIEDADLEIMERLASDSSDAEIKAFFLDLLWIKKRNYKSAKGAINSFIDSAKYLGEQMKSRECTERLKRAAILTASLGKQQPEFDRVTEALSAAIANATAEELVTMRPAWRMMILMNLGAGDPKKYAPICETLAKRSVDQNRWELCRVYWNLKSDWHLQEKDEEKAVAAKLAAAESYISESEAVLLKSPMGKAQAGELLSKAVQALRDVRAEKTRIDEVFRKMLRLKEEFAREIPVQKLGGVDISDSIRASSQAVSGKDLRSAIHTLCFCLPPVSREDLMKRFEESKKQYLFIHLFGKDIIDAVVKR